MSPLRRTVSRRMVESWTTIPKINQFADADISNLLALRKKNAPGYEKQGVHLTLTAFLLVVLGRALKKHPRANSSLDESTMEIVYKNYCHIGVAVDTEGGLIVPILRDVDRKNLAQLSQELHAITERTRQRKISIEELQGGTFTISNQGSIGGSHFTPIIYAPQVAILGVGQGQPKPAAIDGKIGVRTILPLCLAYDHRVLDGADAVRRARGRVPRRRGGQGRGRAARLRRAAVARDTCLARQLDLGTHRRDPRSRGSSAGAIIRRLVHECPHEPRSTETARGRSRG